MNSKTAVCRVRPCSSAVAFWAPEINEIKQNLSLTISELKNKIIQFDDFRIELLLLTNPEREGTNEKRTSNYLPPQPASF